MPYFLAKAGTALAGWLAHRIAETSIRLVDRKRVKNEMF